MYKFWDFSFLTLIEIEVNKTCGFSYLMFYISSEV